MSKPIALALTPEQLKALEPLFMTAKAAAEVGLPGMIVAQVYEDGLLVGFLNNSKGKEWQRVCGNSGALNTGGLSEAVVLNELYRARTGAV